MLQILHEETSFTYSSFASESSLSSVEVFELKMLLIKNEELFEWWCEKIGYNESKANILCAKINDDYGDFTESERLKIRKKLLEEFLPHLKSKLKSCKYRKTNFKRFHQKFLNNTFSIDFDVHEINNSHAGNKQEKRAGHHRTTSVSFQDACARTKQRRSKYLSESYSEVELAEALKVKLKSNKKSAHQSLQVKKPKKIVEAQLYDLVEYIDSRHSKRSCTRARRIGQHHKGSYVKPPYSKIRKLRKSCYPEEELLKITQTGASVEPQVLLDHTIDRLFEDMSQKQKKN